MAIPKDVLDCLMKDYRNPEDLIGENGLFKQLTKQLLERAMQAEMTEHLGYEKNEGRGFHYRAYRILAVNEPLDRGFHSVGLQILGKNFL